MSAALCILPTVWATAAVPEVMERWLIGPIVPVVPQVAFYRKYTEAILRKYLRLSMEAGRAPSLLGREMFRGKVTSYRVHSFEDVVIFVHDVAKCMEMLGKGQQHLIRRIAVEEYTHGETAEMMGLAIRTVARKYNEALDRLTRILVEVKLLEPMKACQGGSAVSFDVSE
ncbi:MAG: hypothetical protein NVS1B16_11000 [Pseudarthrobacter sp.]